MSYYQSQTKKIIALAILTIAVTQQARQAEIASNNNSNSDDSDDEENPRKRRRIEEITVDSYSDEEFRIIFRLKKSTFSKLLEKVFNNTTGTESPAISYEKRLLVTLWFLGNSGSVNQISQLFSIDEDVVQTIIRNTIHSLNQKSPQFINWPTKNEAIMIEKSFFIKENRMHSIIGVIDQCDIKTRKNGESNLEYIQRKSYSDVILEVIVDNKSKFRRYHLASGPNPTVTLMNTKSNMYGLILLGDSSYPSRNFLVPPFVEDNENLTDSEKQFNALHSSHRVCSKNAFSLLKGRWRRLTNFHNEHFQFVCRATIAAMTIHNFCIDSNDFCDDLFEMKSFQKINFNEEELENNNEDRRGKEFRVLFGKKK